MTWVNLTQEIHHCFIIWWRQWSRYETILEGATPRHDAIQHNTSQLDALKLTQNTAQHNTTQHNTTENSKAQHKTMKFHTTQHTIINHNSSKHNTPQPCTTEPYKSPAKHAAPKQTQHHTIKRDTKTTVWHNSPQHHTTNPNPTQLNVTWQLNPSLRSNRKIDPHERELTECLSAAAFIGLQIVPRKHIVHEVPPKQDKGPWFSVLNCSFNMIMLQYHRQTLKRELIK